MNIDVVGRNRELRRFGERSGFDAFFWAAFALLFMVSITIFYREANATGSEVALQGRLAAQIRFSDPVGIWRLSPYPLWNVTFAVLYKLGVPFAWAAAAACAAYKLLGFVLVQRVIDLYLAPEVNAKLATLAALAVMFVTAVRIPSLNPGVFAGVGSPVVWHSPAQIAGQAMAILCLFYATHCLFGFRELCAQADEHSAMLPWKQAGILSALLLLGALCRPEFLWAFLPAFGVYLLAIWIKNMKHPRFVLQMLLATLPATAVIVLRHGGGAGGIAVSPESVWLAVRNMLLMAAFPLLALLLVPRKETFRDPVLRLCLLLAAVSVAESALFSQASADSNWAGMTAVFLLWVVMLPRFINGAFTYRYQRLRLQQDARCGAVSAASLGRAQTRLNLKSIGFLGGTILLLWHLYSGVYYLYSLFSSGGVL